MCAGLRARAGIARADPDLPRALRKLDIIEVILLDDLGYVRQSPDEADVLFTLLDERYERRSVVVTSKPRLRLVESNLPRPDGHSGGDSTA